MPPKTGSVKSIRSAKMRQVVFLIRQLYRAPTSRRSQLRDFGLSSAGGMSARFSSFSADKRSRSLDFSSMSAVSRSFESASCFWRSATWFSKTAIIF